MLGGHLGITNIDEGTLQYLIDTFAIETMIDVGCGPGGMVEIGRKLGLKAYGLDGDITVKSDIVHDFTLGPYDIEQTDLAWSVEFLEHVKEKYLGNIFSVFSKCRYVFCTHNGKPGPWHSNCEPNGYWINIFEDNNFKYDEVITLEIKKNSTMAREFVQDTGTFFRNQKE